MEGISFESPYLVDGRQWAWNSSSLDPAKACSREYFYRARRGLRPKIKSADILFGGWYAHALEIYHRRRAEGESHTDAMRATVRHVIYVTWEWQSNDPNKNRETLIRSIIWYLDAHENDPCKTIILGSGRPAVELPFRFQVSDEVWFTGHLDRLVEHSGDVYVQDQKTTRRTLGAYYFKQFDLSVQMSLYTLAAQVIWNVPVKGVLIDAAQIAVGFTRFERGFTFRSPEQLNEWLKHSLWSIKKVWEGEKEGWPLNDAACGRYGGCDFRSVCSKPERVRESYLKADFVEQWRNPL